MKRALIRGFTKEDENLPCELHENNKKQLITHEKDILYIFSAIKE